MAFSLKALFVFALSAALSACTGFARPAPTGSTVKIVLEGGHGSGVHIGDRFVITAAHVVGSADSVEIKADDGSTQRAAVLWVNKSYDIALLRYAKPANMAVASLSCREAQVGERVRALGSPGAIDFISNNGFVSGSARKHGPWASVLVFDGIVAPGMSGGPVHDATGRVIGITVGLMAVPMGFGASLIPISYIVPSSAVCMLMARV